MATDRWHDLLRQADDDAGPPPTLPANLAACAVRRLAARRRRIIVLTSAAAALLVVALLPLVHLAGRGPTPPDTAHPAPTIAPRGADLSALTAEADSRRAVARQVTELCRQDDRIAALQAEIAQPDPVERARAEVDQTALVLVRQGDRLQRDLGLAAPAADSYRQAIRLFPASSWAAEAREKLAQMSPPKGESS
jgi:hypothetical protein